jgi:hypothetical protein
VVLRKAQGLYLLYHHVLPNIDDVIPEESVGTGHERGRGEENLAIVIDI